MLIESTGSLGGSGTTALVPAWCPFSDKEKIIYRGLAEKVFAAAKAGMDHVASDALDWVPIDPERLKRVYDELVTEAGATVLFQTLAGGVEMRATTRWRRLSVRQQVGADGAERQGVCGLHGRCGPRGVGRGGIPKGRKGGWGHAAGDSLLHSFECE